ncbi:MAG: radical SAM protein [Candidatus Kapabacteria bacterium]|nr:radical SAM protein [Candidatus Kapabacteria bacterium]
MINSYNPCNLCPHNCNSDRFSSTSGKCCSSAEMRIASYQPHFGEEPELVGSGGSGTIFFSGCSLRCVFCQNYEISHEGRGEVISSDELVDIIFELQDYGCNNINFVTPTHYGPTIAAAIEQAKLNGLNIPTVWNSSCYEKVETLKSLEGLIDIYMPDIKFVKTENSSIYTIADNYFEFASKAVLEMYRQVGDLHTVNGRAVSGMLVRHLVLPNNQGDTRAIIDFIADNVGTQTYLNLLDQYHPAYKALSISPLNKYLEPGEFEEYVDYARSRGFKSPDYIYRSL